LSARRRILRGLAILGAAGATTLAGLAGGVYWLNTSNGNEWIRQQIITQAAPYLPEASLDLERLRLSLRGELELENISLTRWDGTPLLTIARIRWELDPARLLGDEVNVGRIVIDRPDVRLEVLDDGELDWIRALGLAPDPDAPVEPPQPWQGLEARVGLERLSIHEGRVRYVQDGETFSITDIGASTAIKAGGGRRASVQGLSIDLVPGPYDPVGLSGDIRYQQSTVIVDALDVNFGDTAAEVYGTIAQVEVRPALGLTVNLLPISAGVASPWTHDQTPAQDINVAARVHGPLADLKLDAALTTVSGQSARLHGQVDLTAEPLSWEGVFSTEALDVDPLVPAVTEAVRLSGRYSITGSGTAWPDGIEATITAEAGEQIIWGQTVNTIGMVAALADGRLVFEQARVEHPAGNVDVLSGDVDIVNSKVDVVVDVGVPSLRELSSLGLVGYRGAVTARGPVQVSYGADPLTVDAALLVQARSVGSADFSLAAADAPVTVSVVGETVTFSGEAALSELEASGVVISSLSVSELTGSYLPTGEVETSSVVKMGRLQVGDGTFVLDDLEGSVVAGVDAAGLPVLDTALQLGAMSIAPIRYNLDGGPVELELRDNELFADLVLSRNERVVMNTRTRGNLDSGEWRVEELMLFPADKRGLAIPTSKPVTFKLVEGGVDGVQLVMVLASESPDVVDPRLLELEEASYISLSGGTAGDAPDVSLIAKRVDMGWVSDVVNVFFSAEDGTAAVPELAGAVDAELTVVGLDAAATIDGTVSLTDLVYPDVAKEVDAAISLGGRLGRPEVSVDVSDAQGLLLAARAFAPIDLEAGSLVCDAELGLRAMVAPVTLKRLTRRFPAAGELPEGEMSADLHLTGAVCDPTVAATAAVSVPVGVHGEHGRVDFTVTRGEAGLILEAGLDEGGMRRVSLDGTATDRLSEVIRWGVEGGEAPDLTDPQTYISDVNLSLAPLGLSVDLIKRLTGVETAVSGQIAGVVQVSGSLDDPQALAVLQLSEGRVGDLDLKQTNLELLPTTDASGAHSGYSLNTLLDFEGPKALEFRGEIPLTIARIRDEEVEELYKTEGWKLGFVGEGWLPLAALNGVVDGVEDASGDLLASGEFSGSLDALDPTATLKIVDGVVGYVPLETIYEDINLSVSVQPEKVVIRPSSMTSRPMYTPLGPRESGRATLSGDVGLDQLSPTTLDLTMSLDDFWLSSTEEMRIAVSTAEDNPLTVTKTYPALQVRGGILLTEGDLTFGESFWTEGSGLALDERITVIRNADEQEPPRPPKEEPEPSALMMELDAELSVDLGKKLKLDVEMPLSQDYGQQFAALSTVFVSAEMDGTLAVGYHKNELSLVGDVEFSRGEVATFGRSFSLDDDSVIHFTGKDYANPNLEMSARYTTSSYGDVVMNISKTALDPGIALESENASQEYDETDLFSILFFGKPASAMADSEGESSSALLSAALSQVTGSVGSALSGTLVDEVDWDPDSGVRVGKAINDKLFLSYDWNNDPDEGDNYNQVTLEWLISRRAFAEFMTGDEAQSSAELYWRVLFGDDATRHDGDESEPPADSEP